MKWSSFNGDLIITFKRGTLLESIYIHFIKTGVWLFLSLLIATFLSFLKNNY